MRNVMVLNYNGEAAYRPLMWMVRAQEDVLPAFNWENKDTLLLTNCIIESKIPMQRLGHKMNAFCYTSKLFAVQHLLNEIDNDEVVWAHDLDVWQNNTFPTPDFKDIGLCEYFPNYYNGGSVFFRKSALDIVDMLVKELTDKDADREEPTMNIILRSDDYKDRVTCLNTTYNVGSNNFQRRVELAEKPIKCLHFNPIRNTKDKFKEVMSPILSPIIVRHFEELRDHYIKDNYKGLEKWLR
jgi:hypothetical protein